MNVVAGLTTVISEDKGAWATPVHFECCLTSLSNILIPSDDKEQVSEQPMAYKSMVVPPAFRYG
jgi:hypothetical protein